MQEQLNRAMAGMTELAAPTDTPSLEEVRDKIEGRYARALGEAEMQSTSVEARMLQVERASIDAEGEARLESIREGLGLPSPSATPEIEPTKKTPSDGP
jgi:phage shock protein A